MVISLLKSSEDGLSPLMSTKSKKKEKSLTIEEVCRWIYSLEIAFSFEAFLPCFLVILSNSVLVSPRTCGL